MDSFTDEDFKTHIKQESNARDSSNLAFKSAPVLNA